MKFKKTFFTEQLRKIMFARNLTQKDLGEMLGVSRQMVNQWLTTDRKPSFDSLEKISKALKVPAAYFIDGNGNENGNENVNKSRNEAENNNKNNSENLIKSENKKYENAELSIIMKLIEENNKRVDLEISLLKKDNEKMKKEINSLKKKL